MKAYNRPCLSCDVKVIEQTCRSTLHASGRVLRSASAAPPERESSPDESLSPVGSSTGGLRQCLTSTTLLERTLIPLVLALVRMYPNPNLTFGLSADTTHNVTLNTDSTVQIVKLHTKFSDLHDFANFQTLFNEYQITSIKHKLIPYYKNNVPFTQGNASTAAAIPQLEIFAFPVSRAVRTQDMAAMTGAEFNHFANASIRKSQRIMPSGVQTWWTKQPKVVGYAGPTSKDAGVASMYMTSPKWFSTNPAAIVTGGPDQTTIQHYGLVIAVRRVDGQSFNIHGQGENLLQFMGYRMENQVFFRCRKVK